MVMLNMLLAIIMDTYSAVKSEIMSQPGVETVWSQSAEIWRRKMDLYRGLRMPFAEILSILDPTNLALDDDDELTIPEETLTVAVLQEKVPKMKESQAIRILGEACVMEDFYAEQADSDMSKQVREIRDTVKKLLRKSDSRKSDSPWAI